MRANERPYKKIIEWELRNYHNTVCELAMMREEIIDGGGAIQYDAIRVQCGPGNPTENKVMRLRSSVALREMERRVEAIGYLLHGLANHPEKGRLRLIEMKYFENRYTDDGICEQLKISKATFYNWRNESLNIIADRLGYR